MKGIIFAKMNETRSINILMKEGILGVNVNGTKTEKFRKFFLNLERSLAMKGTIKMFEINEK